MRCHPPRFPGRGPPSHSCPGAASLPRANSPCSKRAGNRYLNRRRHGQDISKSPRGAPARRARKPSPGNPAARAHCSPLRAEPGELLGAGRVQRTQCLGRSPWGDRARPGASGGGGSGGGRRSPHARWARRGAARRALARRRRPDGVRALPASALASRPLGEPPRPLRSRPPRAPLRAAVAATGAAAAASLHISREPPAGGRAAAGRRGRGRGRAATPRHRPRAAG